MEASSPSDTDKIFITQTIICILFVFFQFPHHSRAASHSGKAPQVPRIQEVSVFKAEGELFSPSQIMAKQQAWRFIPASSPLFFSPHEQTVWLRLRIADLPTAQDRAWSVDLHWNHLRGMEIYQDGEPSSPVASHGDWNVYTPSNFIIHGQSESQQTYYVRLRGYNGMHLHPEIVALADAHTEDALTAWVLGALFGIMAVMAAYNGFLFLTLRDASYLWYVAHTVLLIFNYTYLNGLPPFVPGPGTEAGFHNDLRLYYAGNSLLFFSLGMFSRSFLMIAGKTLQNAASCAQLGIAAALLPVALVSPAGLAGPLSSLVGLAAAIVIPANAALRLRSGYRPALPFLCGIGLYLTGGIAHVLVWCGAIAPSFLAFHAIQMGTVAEVVIMSLALAYRIKLLREEARRLECERQRLGKENALFSLILDDERLGLGVIENGSFRFANRRMAALLDHEAPLAGVSVDSHPEFSTLFSSLEEAQANRAPERIVELPRSGSPRHLRMLGRTIDAATPGRGIVVILEDVSEKIRLEQFRESIEQVMRHDLKAPLATLCMLPDALLAAGAMNEKQTRLCTIIQDGAQALLDQINTSLTLYRIESGTYPYTPEPVDLVRVIEEVRTELSLPYPAAVQIPVSLAPGRTTFLVEGNHGLLRIMVQNLLKNALEAQTDAPFVRVVLDATRGPQASFINRGEVPEAIRSNFFEKFVTANKKGGTGLGTYSVRLIARTIGATALLDTSQPGQTAVTIRFRALPADQ